MRNRNILVVAFLLSSLSGPAIGQPGRKPCGGAGGVCADGTVYFGELNGQALFTTRCDLGQAWNGESCSGQRLTWKADLANSPEDGRANARKVLERKSDSAWEQAVRGCDALNAHGKTDWYLPSKEELKVLLGLSKSVGFFDQDEYYWSSSEMDNILAAWSVRLPDGYHSYFSKTTSNLARCIRRNEAVMRARGQGSTGSP